MSSKEDDESIIQSHDPESTTVNIIEDEPAISSPPSKRQHNYEDGLLRKETNPRAFRLVVDFETFRKDDKSGWPEIVKLCYSGHIDSDGDRVKSLASREHIEGKHRFVALKWPRDPNGEFMNLKQHFHLGKMTSNGIERWGATLYDFYMVNRAPKVEFLQTISTGSILAAWCKLKGELDWAKAQLRGAEAEMRPRQIDVFDIGKYLEEIENQVAKGMVGKSMRVERSDTEPGIQFLCSPSEYPAPWPLRPFSVPLARLQRKYSHSELPKVLIVHDPWNVLLTGNDGPRRIPRSQCKWGSKADNVRLYNLELSANPEKIEEEGKYKLAMAHLYLSPRRRIGSGNHSFVYQAELELPREMLVRPKSCWRCLSNRFRLIKASLKNGTIDIKNKKWYMETSEEEMETLYRQLCEPQEGPNVEVPVYNIKLLKKLDEWGAALEEIDALSSQECESEHESDGEKRVHNVEFWKKLGKLRDQAKPPYCEHLNRNVPIPPSHHVSVTAKLCLPGQRDGDNHKHHLVNEAKLYQEFPSHMFEHWNGYNIIPPMHEPTPVGAVVPQFYGYYVPDKWDGPLATGYFMSPILLLEHCGVQVNPRDLLIDDRHECFSLIRRLHHAGYVHNSIYQRNFVMQYGPLQEWPYKRSKLHMRFRLIDFGRTTAAASDEHHSKPSGEILEEMRNAAKSLEVTNYANF